MPITQRIEGTAEGVGEVMAAKRRSFAERRKMIGYSPVSYTHLTLPTTPYV